jgi:hypothetical protein
MGLYCIPLRPEKIKAIPSILKSIGFPVVRTERHEKGTCYICANPKRSNKNWLFWVSPEKKGSPRFFMCGLSQLSKHIVNALTIEELFDKENLERRVTTTLRSKYPRRHSALI